MISANTGVIFNGVITATGGQLATGEQKNMWSISGFIPGSLTFNGGFIASNQVTITGTPVATDAGVYNFTVTVQDPQGNSQSKQYSLNIVGPPPPTSNIVLTNNGGNHFSWTYQNTTPTSWIVYFTEVNTPPPPGLVVEILSGTSTSTNVRFLTGFLWVLSSTVGQPASISNSVAIP
jgi:Putative Ig domain